MPWAEEEATDIHAAFAETVTYNGAGLANAAIAAIFSDVEAPTFEGPGETRRKKSFEVRQETLPQAPAKGNTIVRDEVTWRVNQITKKDDVGAYELVVERVS